MRHRLFWLGLWLAASPLAAQSPNLSNYRPGTLRLELAPGLTSQLGFDEKHLNEVLCGVMEGGQSRGGASRGNGSSLPGETCRLVISNDGGPNGRASSANPVAVSAAAQGLSQTTCGPAQVTLLPTALHLKGAQLLELECGLWSFEAELAARASAPPSTLSLLPAAPGSQSGLFTGALALRLDLVYTYAGSGIENPPSPFQETRDMVFDVAGRWTVAQTGLGSPLSPSETNLVLFADRAVELETESVWRKKGVCAPGRRGCSCLCLEASTAAVAALNGQLVY